ncbi:hypothetical protein [Sutcliffiella rhizosphaerae]|uniref:Uncharacterized protein n=1 Tax=Sutcliffiella rhizosphaerae TaxID=2880967 RepID=A0ABN8ABD9_9BACI|nr:hypothetical protein [Sutcliffiella rhizosphaerae]CAG9621799.1 hypothetical protein BACCIP111883_02572 [Sutcliffiella rhizosphaerae]
MERILLFLAAMLAGFGLLRVPMTGTFAALEPITNIVGVISVLIFSLALIYLGLKNIIKR